MSSHTDKPRPGWAVDHEFTEAIKRSENDPALEALPPYQRPTIRPGDPLRFSINTVAEPTSWQGKRGYLISPMPGWSGYEIFCDEGTVIGGTDLAPSPLGYLTSAIAFCMLTHITGYLARNPLEIKRIKVEMRGEFWSSLGVAGDGGPSRGRVTSNRFNPRPRVAGDILARNNPTPWLSFNPRPRVAGDSS